MDGFARHDAALRQRTEANGTRMAGQLVEGRSVGDVIPGHALLNIIAGHTGGTKFHLHGTGRVRHGFDERGELTCTEAVQNFSAQLVLPYGTDHAAFQTELRHMIGKVGGRTAQLFPLGQHVPQGFAHSYYYGVIIIHD